LAMQRKPAKMLRAVRVVAIPICQNIEYGSTQSRLHD
jgi:hypothetical protein